MRTLLMAGTALMLMGGVALAQSATGGTSAAGGQTGSAASGSMNSSMSHSSHAMMWHQGMGNGNAAYISHHMGGNMPVGASAETYLHIAQRAVMAHDKAHAQVALGRVETDLLTNSYVQGTVNGPISSPAISAVRDARRAVQSGQYQNASMMIHKAMTEMHGGMMSKPGGMMRNPGMAPSNGGMAPPNGMAPPKPSSSM